MKNLLTFAVLHAALWAALYAAFALNIEGALYVVTFYVWATLPLMCFSMHPEVIEILAKNPARPVRRLLDLTQAWTMLACLVWFGHIVTAAALAITMLLTAAIRHRVSLLREKNEVAA